MTLFDSGATLADRFRRHAGTSNTLYGHAMRAMADDWEAGGPVRTVCAAHQGDPEGSAIQLRLLAGVFRIVLTGRAPELVPFYPCLGGDFPADQAWPAMRRVIGSHIGELQQALEVAPQTNEVGRSAALLAGLFDLVAVTGVPDVVVLELGASAGLNLLLDRYRLSGDGWDWGDAGSPVQLSDAITGPVRPQTFAITGRRGCDLAPVDVTTEAGRLLLTSFVWPFDLHRHRRLAAALTVAQDDPPVVDRASAGDWLAGQLDAMTWRPDQLVVVWQSITELYWPAAETERVRQVLTDHGRRHRLGQVAMEFAPVPAPPVPGAPAAALSAPAVSTTLWRPDEPSPVRRRRLGYAHDHGIPVRLG